MKIFGRKLKNMKKKKFYLIFIYKPESGFVTEIDV